MLRKIIVAACVALPLTLIAQDQKQPLRKFELKAESEDFWKLIDRGAKLEKFAGGFGFTEGPVWDPQGFLYISDEIKNQIVRVFPGGRLETVFKTGDPDGSTMIASIG